MPHATSRCGWKNKGKKSGGAFVPYLASPQRPSEEHPEERAGFDCRVAASLVAMPLKEDGWPAIRSWPERRVKEAPAAASPRRSEVAEGDRGRAASMGNVKGPHRAKLKKVSLTFASWNHIGEWLRRLDSFRRVA